MNANNAINAIGAIGAINVNVDSMSAGSAFLMINTREGT
jgi:hypothetical protein